MPQLRFNRDRRGYETTTILQARARGGKGQRILYFFRTPPAVRVGRAPIDEDAIRQIEEHNPDVEFDWSRILKGGAAPVEAEPRRTVRGQRTERRERRSPRADIPAEPPRRDVANVAQQEPDPEPPPAVERAAVAPPPLPEFEAHAGDEDVEPALVDDDARPVYQRLGAEGLARLRARYAEVMARISERQLDDAMRDELKLAAERLNPDAWVTADEVAAGLEQYESVYERLRAVVGQPRRRRRRR